MGPVLIIQHIVYVYNFHNLSLLLISICIYYINIITRNTQVYVSRISPSFSVSLTCTHDKSIYSLTCRQIWLNIEPNTLFFSYFLLHEIIDVQIFVIITNRLGGRNQLFFVMNRGKNRQSGSWSKCLDSLCTFVFWYSIANRARFL